MNRLFNFTRECGRGVWNVFISLDQLGNVLVGALGRPFVPGFEYGDPDETISSVLGRRTQLGKTRLVERWLVWVLDKVDRDHVFEAIEKQPQMAMLHAPRWQKPVVT